MTVTVNVGHTVTNTIVYLDQNGNVMLQTPVPDKAPVWTDSGSAANPPLDSVNVSPDGSTAVVTALSAGTDNLSVALTVGGSAFSASVAIGITPAPQVLTSIAINSVVS